MVKRENQQDATNSMFIIKRSVSTCFGHNYTHHQENKTVSYCMQCRIVTYTQVKTQLHKTTANHNLHTQAEHRM